MLKAPHLIPHLCQSLRLGLRRRPADEGPSAADTDAVRSASVPAASRSSQGRLRTAARSAARVKHPGLPVLLVLILVSLVALAVFVYLSDGLAPPMQRAAEGDWSLQHHLLRYLR
ncbi:hypothetical protein [Paracidovorax citrulli]